MSVGFGHLGYKISCPSATTENAQPTAKERDAKHESSQLVTYEATQCPRGYGERAFKTIPFSAAFTGLFVDLYRNFFERSVAASVSVVATIASERKYAPLKDLMQVIHGEIRGHHIREGFFIRSLETSPNDVFLIDPPQIDKTEVAIWEKYSKILGCKQEELFNHVIAVYDLCEKIKTLKIFCTLAIQYLSPDTRLTIETFVNAMNDNLSSVKPQKTYGCFTNAHSNNILYNAREGYQRFKGFIELVGGIEASMDPKDVEIFNNHFRNQLNRIIANLNNLLNSVTDRNQFRKELTLLRSRGLVAGVPEEHQATMSEYLNSLGLLESKFSEFFKMFEDCCAFFESRPNMNAILGAIERDIALAHNKHRKISGTRVTLNEKFNEIRTLLLLRIENPSDDEIAGQYVHKLNEVVCDHIERKLLPNIIEVVRSTYKQIIHDTKNILSNAAGEEGYRLGLMQLKSLEDLFTHADDAAPDILFNVDNALEIALRSRKIFHNAERSLKRKTPFALCFTPWIDFDQYSVLRFFTNKDGRLVAVSSKGSLRQRVVTECIPERHPLHLTIQRAARDHFNSPDNVDKGFFKSDSIFPGKDIMMVVAKHITADSARTVRAYLFEMSEIIDMAMKINLYTMRVTDVHVIKTKPFMRENDEKQVVDTGCSLTWDEVQTHIARGSWALLSRITDVGLGQIYAASVAIRASEPGVKCEFDVKEYAELRTTGSISAPHEHIPPLIRHIPAEAMRIARRPIPVTLADGRPMSSDPRELAALLAPVSAANDSDAPGAIGPGPGSGSVVSPTLAAKARAILGMDSGWAPVSAERGRGFAQPPRKK